MTKEVYRLKYGVIEKAVLKDCSKTVVIRYYKYLEKKQQWEFQYSERISKIDGSNVDGLMYFKLILRLHYSKLEYAERRIHDVLGM